MLKIYCDGACSGNPGPGGWAFVIPAKNVEQSGYDYDTTNNRMEITACVEALELALSYIEVDDVEIITDSQYVVNTMTLNWQRKKNVDLWKKLDWLISKFRKIKWTWVKGHSDNKYNQRCDELAVQEYKSYQEYNKKQLEEENRREINWYGEKMPINLNQKIDIQFSPYEKYNVGKEHYVQLLKCTALDDVFAAEADSKELLCVGSYSECRQALQNYKSLVEDDFRRIPF